MTKTEKEYYGQLCARIFKILLVYEDDSMEKFYKYCKTIYYELLGNDKYAEIYEVAYKINGILVHEADHETVKKTVFECRSIIKKIIETKSKGE